MGRGLVFLGLAALLATVVVASAATLRVDGGALQVFTVPVRIELPAPKVQFLVPGDIDLTIEGENDPGQQIITIGGEASTTNSGDCSQALDALPLQNAVVTDPNIQGTRLLISTLIPLQMEPLPPGTKLRKVVGMDTCTIDGVDHKRYQADRQ
jgi:hypothetical protein